MLKIVIEPIATSKQQDNDNVYNTAGLPMWLALSWFFLFFFTLFIHFSLLSSSYYFIPTHTSTHRNTAPPCRSMNVTPVHLVTRVMTTATDHTPSSIPMVLISWLAAMQRGYTAVPLLYRVCECGFVVVTDSCQLVCFLFYLAKNLFFVFSEFFGSMFFSSSLRYLIITSTHHTKTQRA